MWFVLAMSNVVSKNGHPDCPVQSLLLIRRVYNCTVIGTRQTIAPGTAFKEVSIPI